MLILKDPKSEDREFTQRLNHQNLNHLKITLKDTEVRAGK